MSEQEQVYRAGISERIAVPPLAVFSAYMCYVASTNGYFSMPVNIALIVLSLGILTASLHPFMRKVVVAKDYLSYRKLIRTTVVKYADVEAYWMELFNNREPRSLKVRYLSDGVGGTLEIKRSRIFYVAQIFDSLQDTVPDRVPDCTEEVYASMGLARRMVNEFHFWIVVVALLVLAFLGSIILPHVMPLKPSRVYSEARISLVRISMLQKDFHKKHGEYAAGFEPLKFKFVGKSKYTYFYSRGDIIKAYPRYMAVEGFDELKQKAPTISEMVPETVNTTGYTVIAVGNIDDDDGLDIWAVNDDNNVVHLLNDSLP